MEGSIRTSGTEARNRIVGRPRYIPLGVDANACHHVWSPATERIHVIANTGDRDVYSNIAGEQLEDWMAFVDRKCGWNARWYGVSLAERLAEAIDG
jgi:hypothetical protein